MGLALGVMVGVGASSARADNAAAAQALFDEGKKAMAAHQYVEACPKLEESLRLDYALGTLLNLADCREHEGKLATAWTRFLELAARAREAGQVDRAKIGRQRAAELAGRLSNLVINVGAADRTPGLQVSRDGTVVGAAAWATPIPADPGTHSVEASAPGRLPWSTSVNVTGNATTSTVTVPELLPSPKEAVAAAPHPSATTPLSPTASVAPSQESRRFGVQRGLAVASAAVGVAGVAAGSYFGLTSLADHNDAENDCSHSPCNGPRAPAAVTKGKAALSNGNSSNVAFAVGVVGLAGAVVLWFTAPTGASTEPNAQVGIGAGTLQLRGQW